MKRQYKIVPEALASYMAQNLHKSVIVGETDDTYMVQNGKKVHQLQKNAVESFALDHGFVQGQGYDAMSEQNKGTFQSNRKKDTVAKREAVAYQATTKDENLQAYHNQLTSTRRANAQAEVHKPTVKPYKGNKSYSGSGTNQ